MKVTVTQREDFHFVGTGPSGRELPIDAAEYVGGKGRGLRPPELLFHAIASCVGIHLHESLVKRGTPATSIAITTDADRRTEAYPKVFTAIRLAVRVAGAGLTEEGVREALHAVIHDPGTCSVAYMIDRLAPITCDVELVA